MNADVGEGVGAEGGRVDERGRGRMCRCGRRSEGISRYGCGDGVEAKVDVGEDVGAGGERK